MKEEKKNQSILSTEFSDQKFGGISLKEICSKLTGISDSIALNLSDEEIANELDLVIVDIQKYMASFNETIDDSAFKGKENSNVE